MIDIPYIISIRIQNYYKPTVSFGSFNKQVFIIYLLISKFIFSIIFAEKMCQYIAFHAKRNMLLTFLMQKVF